MENVDFLIKEAKKQKMSLKQIKALPPATLLRVINKAKKLLKKDEIWKKLCEEYGEEVDVIDYIPTYFKNLDVSAKTDHGVVYLNYRLLLDGLSIKDISYLIHEYTHFFQQCYGKKATQSSDDGNYLENPYEQEAFTNQVSHINENLGEEEAQDYVDNLLDYHEVDDKKEKNELEEILMSEV